MASDGPHDQARNIIIVGAGASGLAAALAAARGGLSVKLLERGAQVGGNLATLRDGEWRSEIGPNTLIMKPPLYRLLQETGLLDEAQTARSQARKRYVSLEGRPVALPTHPLRAFGNPLVGLSGLAGIAREPFVRRAQGNASSEESLAAFVERRLGRRVLEYMVDPFVSGVYAGDPRRLSAQAAMPRLAALERGHGSLLRGGMAKFWQSRRAGAELPPQWRGKLVGFPDGMQRLAARLGEEISAAGGDIHCGCEVSKLRRDGTCWVVEDATGQRWRAPQLVLAVSAPVAAALLKPLDETLAAPLDEIAYPPVNAVALGFRRADIAHALDGFGVLIPSVEKRRTLGALFSSSIFDGRAPAQHCLINAFIGGRRQPQAADGSDDEQVAQVLADLRDLLGIHGQPVWQHVSRWPQAIPQYELGHLDRIAALDEALAHHEGLSMVGNWRDGIAVGDCLENGRRLGEQVAAGCHRSVGA